MIDSFSGRYSFLSNFFRLRFCITTADGIYYPTVEHAYQAMKTKDMADRVAISRLTTPGQAKRYGRKIKDLPADWDYQRLQVMSKLLALKFTDDVDLRQKLINTGTEQLVEGNDWGDTYWGKSNVRGLYGGENHLGRLLMELRSILQHGKF